VRARATRVLGQDPDEDRDRPAGVTYLYGHTAPVYAVDFSHDARLVLSGAGDGTVRLWSRCAARGRCAWSGEEGVHGPVVRGFGRVGAKGAVGRGCGGQGRSAGSGGIG